MSDPSETTTIPDAYYFAAMEQGGGPPESNREAFVRTMTNGPVEQQLVNIAGVLYDVGRKVDKLEVKVDKLEVKVDKLEVKVDKLDRNHQEMMNLLRGFITEVRGYNHQV
ncbi:hypothetical protein L211DRAFT_871670 [Terfezia boudieri ATCC MYA-4762]|uniref:Uncharacterized protein n=1 Tax=Terfezia boudieri ATCC MYA-4762 TaxID=1051890 RepID=A0A3N4L786_9PEZI|nr:hypothetical protein L211DRAFT_871670 [Terfezia boudieri ATCC MYA-4762]